MVAPLVQLLRLTLSFASTRSLVGKIGPLKSSSESERGGRVKDGSASKGKRVGQYCEGGGDGKKEREE